MCRSTRRRLSDADTDADRHAAVHPRPDVSGRHADAGADEDAEADGRADADAAAHGRADAERVVRRAHVLAVTDAAADVVSDTVADARVTEPRTRDARLDGFRGDDRLVGVDLAPLSELARAEFANRRDVAFAL